MNKIDTLSCESAQLNMDYDLMQFEQLATSHLYVRVYHWTQRGLTYSYKQSMPAPLSAIDHGQRHTGGGIVFHCPGDCLFTLCGWMNDSRFPKSMKQKMSYITDLIQDAADSTGLNLSHHHLNKTTNYDFCHSYPNPYELFLGTHKVTAITIRKNRDRFLIQGIIHLQNQSDYFKDYSDYTHYFTSGLSSISQTQQHLFVTHLKTRFSTSLAPAR